MLAEKPVRQALVTWLKDYSGRGQIAQPIEDLDLIVSDVFKGAKDAVAVGWWIDEAISHRTASALFRYKSRNTFFKNKADILKVVRAALA